MASGGSGEWRESGQRSGATECEERDVTPHASRPNDVGANQVSRVRDSEWTLPLSALICGPDGGKTARNGVEKATFGGICYVGQNGATHFGDYIYV